ncbi:response regulator [Schlegelella sp. S2-27]|uniref:Response regulator n=1 Tax=Caldimonas mangrovi TaxID=2944811 RepID=A0ABT0YKN0_9BURK|nr:response regulator [Caldimonas mangrovi]MCM5679260.1 response regulator [Caldimonas mangrovi]
MNPHAVTADAPLSFHDTARVAQPPLRVMVIEDSRLIRERLLDLISTCDGFEVTAQAETEADALSELSRRQFDAVVVDLQLREGSGFGVLSALHKQDRRPLTMVLTNTSTRLVRERCLSLGAHHFFDKSNEFDGVAQALDALRVASRLA